MKFVLLFSLVITFSGAARAFDESIETLFEKHCYDCHDDVTAKGGLDLFSLEESNLTMWTRIHDRVKSGEMPPAKKKRPSPKDRDSALSAISESVTKKCTDRYSKTGRVVRRRLNSTEYENTLRDLLNLPNLEVANMLPPDPEAHGFDNVAEAQRLSYVQISRYLEAAKFALEKAAWLAPEIESFKFRVPFIDIRRFQITKDLARIDGQAVLLRQPNTAQTPWRLDGIQLPFPGEHVVRIRARGAVYSQTGPEEGIELRPQDSPQILSLYQDTRWLGSVELSGEYKVYDFNVQLNPDETLFLYIPTLQDWNPKWTKEAYTGPAVALDWVEIEGPTDAEWPKPSYTALFDDLPAVEWKSELGIKAPPELGELKHPKRWPKLTFPNKRNRYHVVPENPETDARRLLESFMSRAFRRPIPDGEVDRYMALVRDDIAKRKPFQTVMINAYSAVLSSPDFLFFTEQPGKLDDHALANRLSYFLWKSPPDETLRKLADAGKLSGNKVEITKQVERMLADEKIERFISDFTGQWLSLREIRSTQPDEKLYPEYDDFLLESMQEETHAYFREILKQNLPARSAIDSEFVFANNVLADLYGLPSIKGTNLQKVTLPAGNPRGGFLTQAAILKVTANGTTTSPVVRGTWVLEHMLGDPAPPPPPNVPAIEPDTRGATTIRELLDKHRADASCATCHVKIDPPGFALESFDVIGGWRERYRSLEKGEKAKLEVDGRPVNYRHGLPVDPAGQLADGRKFAEIIGFKKLLLENETRVAKNLTERLIVYATGGGVTFADRAEVEAILQATANDGYRLRDLIYAVVSSDLFQQK